jgi:anti-anti-sigma regulatory factor
VSPALGDQTDCPVAVIAFPEPASDGSVLALRSRSEQALVTDHRAIVIDLRAAEGIDTQTLSELCAALREISRHGAKLAVVAADQRVGWTLNLCEIDGLELHPTLKNALARSRTNQGRPKRPRARDLRSPRRLALRRSTRRS